MVSSRLRQPDLFEEAARLFEQAFFSAGRLPETEAGTGILPSLHGERDVIERREAEENIGDLIGARHAGGNALVHGEPGHIASGEMDAAGIRLQGTGNVVDEGRFAGAVGADQGMHLTGLDTEIYVF